jgi:hypothetical protein
LARNITSEVADHAADHPGKVVWQLPDYILDYGSQVRFLTKYY